MITEEQRRALFALREALHLCEGAGVEVVADAHQNWGELIIHVAGVTNLPLDTGDMLTVADIDAVLQEHPE